MNKIIAQTKKDLIYGKATLPWNENKKAWVSASGNLIYSRRAAGEYVERLHKIISGAQLKNG